MTRSPLHLGAAAIAALGSGLVIGGLWRTLAGSDGTVSLILLVTVGSIAFGLLAATHFFGFVVAMLLLRAVVDGVLPDASVGALSTSEAVGVLFLGTGLLWLGGNALTGQLRPLSSVSRWAIAFAIAAFASVPLSVGRGTSLASSLKVIVIVTMLLVCEQLLAERPQRIRWILAAVFGSVLLPACYAVGQITGTRFVDANIAVGRVNASFVHPNALATYAAIVAAIGLAVRRDLSGALRRLCYVASALALVLLFFSYARAAWIGMALAVVFIGAVHERRLLLVFAVAMVAIVAFVPSFIARLQDLGEQDVPRGVPANSFEWRLGYWAEVLDAAHGRPVIGLGLDSVQLVMDEELEPHNSLLQVYVELGLLGAVAAAGLGISTIGVLRRRLADSDAGLPRSLAVGTAAAAITVGAQLISENLVTGVASLWYLMALLGWATSADVLRRDAARLRSETDPDRRRELVGSTA